jgi:hypothetical protein
MEHGVVEQFIVDAKADLGDFVRESGVVLYSSPKTLKPGDAYLLGVNPGADPDGLDDANIEAHLEKLRSTDINRYLDGEWDRGRIGQDKFQRRVVWLLRNLGYDPREVCASNLIFSRSHQQKGSGYPATADRCWPVHERILRLVQPRLIICVGNLPFGYIMKHSRSEGLMEKLPSGHGSWRCQGARVHIEDRLVDVVSVPHLNRYKIIDKGDVADWIRWKLAPRPQVETDTLPKGNRVLNTVKTQSVVAPVAPRSAGPTPKVEQEYQVPWDGIAGYILLTGAPFSARGARGRAWDTLRTRNGFPVRDWIPIAKKVGNAGCGRGDLEILCMERRATVIVDSSGRQVYPPTDAPRYHKRP